jgi:uncharacterized protein
LEYTDQFLIQFSGLSTGNHSYEFHINDEFFKHLENSLIQKGEIEVKVMLDKKPTLMTFDLTFKGKVEVECDRCASFSYMPVEVEHRLIVQLGDSYSEEDDLIVIPRTDYQFDLFQHIYDSIALALPLRIVPCEITLDNSFCDQSVISRLEAIHEKQIITAQEIVDPRWDKLKNLGKNSI